MAPALVLAGAVMLSPSPTPESSLQKPCAQSTRLKEELGRGGRHTQSSFSPLAPAGSLLLKMLVRVKLETPHTSGFLALGIPWDRSHDPNSTLEMRDDRKSEVP